MGHLLHPDPAVRELIERERAAAWDKGYRAGRADRILNRRRPNPYPAATEGRQ